MSKPLFDILEELRIDWKSYQGREDLLTTTSTEDKEIIMVSLQDKENKILEILWSK